MNTERTGKFWQAVLNNLEYELENKYLTKWQKKNTEHGIKQIKEYLSKIKGEQNAETKKKTAQTAGDKRDSKKRNAASASRDNIQLGTQRRHRNNEPGAEGIIL